jgi:glucose 1-dehydrogenase
MRSLVLDIEHRRLEERDLPEPSIESPSQVRFRVHEVGVCGTDRELVSFRLRLRPGDAPRIVIGHEALGQVEETGSGVDGIRRGDWVVPMIRRPCSPPCRSCARGRNDLCLTAGFTERGIFGADGYFTEYAVDDARYLVTIPERLIDFAILLEPLSVVEKAIGRALAVRQTEENSALVLGLGPIGILSALVLESRGYRVRVFSLEPADHPRARMMREHGIEYVTRIDGKADVIVEAAGSAELALAALSALGPAGVFVVLGAGQAEGAFSFIDLIVGNQTIVGSVNASPASFAAALADLDTLPSPALRAMIRRFEFADYRTTLFDRPPGTEPKFVHRAV